MMSDNCQVKNQGMTLIELLVSVAMLGIAMIGIISLMNLSTKYYSNSSKEVEVQQELQTTFSMVSNMIVDANVGVSFDAANNKATISSKTKRYVVELSGNKLYAKEFGPTGALTDIKTSANLLADRVESFSINTSHYDDGYVTMAMKVKYGTREAAMSMNVFLRNSGKEKADFFGQCDTSVSGSEFTITQNTGSTISNGTNMVIRLKVATVGSISSVSSAGLSITSRSFNPVTGELTIHCSKSGAWNDGSSIVITVTSSSAINADNSRVLSISK